VIERSHCTYNPLNLTTVNVSLHSKLATMQIAGAHDTE